MGRPYNKTLQRKLSKKKDKQDETTKTPQVIC